MFRTHSYSLKFRHSIQGTFLFSSCPIQYTHTHTLSLPLTHTRTQTYICEFPVSFHLSFVSMHGYRVRCIVIIHTEMEHMNARYILYLYPPPPGPVVYVCVCICECVGLYAFFIFTFCHCSCFFVYTCFPSFFRSHSHSLGLCMWYAFFSSSCVMLLLHVRFFLCFIHFSPSEHRRFYRFNMQYVKSRQQKK